jgi:hypothetical protein
MFKITKYCAYCYDQANQTKIIQKSSEKKYSTYYLYNYVKSIPEVDGIQKKVQPYNNIASKEILIPD